MQTIRIDCKMFVQLTLAAGAALLGSLVVLFVDAAVRTVAARRDFERRAGGLRIADRFSFWAGHVYSFLFCDGQMYKMGELCARHNVKTIGWMYGRTRAASTVDLELVRQIVLEQQDNERILMNLPIKELEVDCLMLATGQQWQRIRRAYAPALKPNKFKTPNVQREVESSINKLVAAIDRKLEASSADEIVLDLDDYAHRYQLDLVLNCFYKQDNLVDFEAQVDPMTQFTDSGYEAFHHSQLIRLCVVFPALKPVIDWLTMRLHPQGAWRARMMQFIKRETRMNFEARKQLEQLKRSGKSVEDEESFTLRDGTSFRRNMIDHVIDQFYERKLTKSEFFHSTWFLFNAAEKTATDAITHTIYQLATHPDVQEKLRKSILVEGEIAEYLAWVVNESLRLLPPVPIGCSRMTTRDYKCQDGIVPTDTFVVTETFRIHRLERYWGADADQFRPERFASAKSFHPLQFIPFGAGPRSCPGKEFVLHEMKRLLCALITRYKFSCEPLDLRYLSPFLFLQLPNKHVHVKISRL